MSKIVKIKDKHKSYLKEIRIGDKSYNGLSLHFENGCVMEFYGQYSGNVCLTILDKIGTEVFRINEDK